jgi:hypothetical protein
MCDFAGGDRVRAVAEDEAYKVVLVVSEARGGRGVEAASFLYRGQVPEEGEEIDVTNESDPGDRRRAKVTRITGGYGKLAEGSVIHATELEP